MKSSANYKRIFEVLLILFIGYGTFSENFTDRPKDACGAHGVCDCRTEGTFKIVDCEDRNLKALPGGIPSDVHAIMLRDNKINELKADSFVRQRVLQVLDISNNSLQELPMNLFSNSSSLLELSLSRNKLKTIPDNLFSKLINLKKLTMEYNDMNMESLNFIAQLSNLERAFLGENKIKTMRPENFQGVHKLGVLCVSDNEMFIQSTRLLSSLVRLQMLCLSSNIVANVPPDSFANLSVMQVLKLGNTSLEDIPDHLFMSMSLLRELELEDNFLFEIRSPHFANTGEMLFLTLSNNRIQRIEKGSFKNLTKVTKIDLRRNRLSTLPENLFIHSNDLHELHLEGNLLVALPTSLFGQSSKLEDLYLSDNNIHTVPENAIQNLPFLNTLHMSGNCIEEFAERTFRNLTSLTMLSLSKNRIKFLPPKIFSPLAKLEVLLLDGNRLQKLSNRHFLKLENLRNLLLRANIIRKIPRNLLISQSKLKHLDMGSNAINELPDNMLANLLHVDDIDLSFNNLTILPKSWLGSVKKIGTLTLSQNRIKEIEKENFEGLAEVNNLYVSHNRLSCLTKDLFSEVVISYSLDLSNNRLTKLTPGFFDSNNKTHGLITLILSRNLLTYLPSNIFSGLKRLKSLCLFHNNIQHLAGGAFAEIGVEKIYLFGNNLSILDDTPFDNENIKEIHLYGNRVNYLNGTVLAGLDITTKVFINCEQVEEVERANVYIICVTPQYVPTLQVNAQLVTSLKYEGFRCDSALVTNECSPCARGTYSDGRGQCCRCPPGGFYQDDYATTPHGNKEGCKRCRNGTYVKKGGAVSIADCVVCPDGTKKNIHAGYRACFCLDNYARVERFGSCFVCKEKGINCTGRDYKTIKYGFYWNWNFPEANVTKYRLFVNNLKTENEFYDTNTSYNGKIPRAFKCRRRESCNNTQGDIEATCSKGYRGWLCNKCEANFYSVMDYCLPCPGTVLLIVEVVMVISFCIIIYIVIMLYYKKEKNKVEGSRSFIDVLISRTKIALGFYQVIGEFFSSLHDVNWAGSLRYVGEFISYIELNILRIFIRPQCYHEKFVLNPKLEFIIGITIPCAVVGLSILLYQAIRIRDIVKARGNVGTCTINKYTKPPKSKIISITILFLFIIYPPICTVIFQLYPRACETFCFDFANHACITVLRSDYDIRCEDLKVYNAFAYVATVGYVVAFPFALLLLLRETFRSRLSPGLNTRYSVTKEDNNSDLQNLAEEASNDGTTTPMWVDFFCENYKPQYWYWEIVELTRKVTQTVLITLLGWEDKLTVLLTIGISVLFLTLHARYMPMKSSFDQRLQMFSLTAILVNVLVAAMEVPDQYGEAISLALLILNVVVITIIAGEVAFHLFLRLRYLQIHRVIYGFAVSAKVWIVNACGRKQI